MSKFDFSNFIPYAEPDPSAFLSDMPKLKSMQEFSCRLEGIARLDAPAEIECKVIRRCNNGNFLCDVGGKEMIVKFGPPPRFRSYKWYQRKARMRRTNRMGARGY